MGLDSEKENTIERIVSRLFGTAAWHTALELCIEAGKNAGLSEEQSTLEYEKWHKITNDRWADAMARYGSN